MGAALCPLSIEHFRMILGFRSARVVSECAMLDGAAHSWLSGQPEAACDACLVFPVRGANRRSKEQRPPPAGSCVLARVRGADFRS